VLDRARLLDLAERQYGLVTRRQVRELGASQSSVRRVAQSADWQELTTHVLRRAGSSRSIEQRLMTAVLDAGGDAVLSHLCGAAWWQVPGCDLEPIVLTTTKRARTRTSLAATHEIRELPAHWVTVRRGIPVARPELIALGMCATCHPDRAMTLIDRMWTRRLLSGRSIAAFLDDRAASGRNGITVLRQYFERRGVDYVPPASGLEGRVKELLADAAIPVRPQVDSGGDSWTGRVDFRHVTRPFIIEVQSEAHHAALVDQAADDARIGQLVEDGFAVVEVTDDDVWLRPRDLVAYVDACLETFHTTGSAQRFNRQTDRFAGQNGERGRVRRGAGQGEVR